MLLNSASLLEVSFGNAEKAVWAPEKFCLVLVIIVKDPKLD